MGRLARRRIGEGAHCYSEMAASNVHVGAVRLASVGADLVVVDWLRGMVRSRLRSRRGKSPRYPSLLSSQVMLLSGLMTGYVVLGRPLQGSEEMDDETGTVVRGRRPSVACATGPAMIQ